MDFWAIALLVLLINLPFGFWRSGVKKFGPQWFLAIHIPVPLVLAVRFISGLGWQVGSFPLMIGAFFAGQFLGGRLRLSLRTQKDS